MSRVQMVQKEQALPQVKEIYDRIEKNGAEIINLYKVVANSPDVLHNFLRLGNSLLAKTELSPKLRELAVLRIARLTGSEYEWMQHYPVALELGMSQEQTEAISHWSDSPSFSDEERAVLQYTDEVAQNVEVKDETFKVLQQHLSEQNIVELTLSIGWWRMVARLLVSLQVDMDTQPVSSVQKLIGRKR